MSTTESGIIALVLLRLFYKLQYADKSVLMKELTRSFGWNTYDSFMQQDVQELNRVLCEKLEEKMKGIVVESTIQNLFGGHQMNYIECINVEFKSTRKESFYDLQLDMKGCKDVYALFDKYVEVEHMEEDNKYHAEGHGLQDAKKGVLFTNFPLVLQLHLKRFEYDFSSDSMVKINDRYEFPLQLDLDRENGKCLSPDADRSVQNLYTLHSVLLHRDGKSDTDRIICDVDENDIAEDLRTRNTSFHLDHPLTPEEEAKMVGQMIREVSPRIHNVELNLFLEVMDLNPEPLPEKTEENILLFFKVYDPEKEEHRYVERMFEKSSGKPCKVLLKVSAGFSMNDDIEILEEVKFEQNIVCKPMDTRSWSRVQDGEIIYIQKLLSREDQEQF
ncbi:OLC1v1031999C1 [Oldenlandia corymbosa var. corymbosa]|uniref:OLC1v1031999C1 n=1 Tax=Oldenlandia corymbosa var. corymbosa TaxID=529605 RepID=A0AAV1CN26_OLDCO|nr:OLC1v1031999C1 [Oldenlandia corymbosa var. corymbosa]